MDLETIPIDLQNFIKHYIPNGWKEPIGITCYVPFTFSYYKETGIPWYIKEAIEKWQRRQ
jgi:hypothetical protein